jgi:hypothetical protein
VKSGDRGGHENKPFRHTCHLGTDKSKSASTPQPNMFVCLFIYLYAVNLTALSYYIASDGTVIMNY